MKTFYKLGELANRWNISVAEVYHMAVTDQIAISFWWQGPVIYEDENRAIVEGFVAIDKNTVKRFSNNQVINKAIEVPYAFRSSEKIALKWDIQLLAQV